MQRKTSQSGRTLLEMLAVLAIIAILSISGLLGYSFLVHRWKRLESVKAVETLALRQKTTPVISGSGKYVNVKTIYPEAQRSGVEVMKLPDSTTSSVQLMSFSRDSFVVVVNSLEGDTCETLLEKGSYSALLKNNDDLTKEEDDPIMEKENTIAKKEASQKNRRKDLCKNNKTLSLVWGGDCSDSESGYWYSGRCNPCPQNQQLDLNGVCCFPNNMNACGYCPPKPNQQQRSCIKTSCHPDYDTEIYCLADKKQCGICVEDKDCCNKNCTRGHCCPKGLVWNGNQNKCLCPDETPYMFEKAGGQTVCCENDGRDGSVCSSDDCCLGGHCAKKGGATEGYCCPANTAWAAISGGCCATDHLSWNSECCEHPVIKRNDKWVCPDCYHDGEGYLIGEVTWNNTGCGYCRAKNDIAYKDVSGKKEGCCNKTTWRWYTDGTTPVGVGTQCVACKNDGTYRYDSTKGGREICCDTDNGNWKNEQAVPGTDCGKCNSSGNIVYKPQTGKASECCDANWKWYTGKIVGCKTCTTGAVAPYSPTTAPTECYECSDMASASWIDRIKAGHRVVSGNCCTNDGTSGATCKVDNCCAGGRVCVSKDAGGNGHCCASTEGWASVSNRCCATDHLSWNGECCTNPTIIRGGKKVCSVCVYNNVGYLAGEAVGQCRICQANGTVVVDTGKTVGTCGQCRSDGTVALLQGKQEACCDKAHNWNWLGADVGCGCGVALWSGAVGASCTKHECCASTNYCNNGKCAELCPELNTVWDEAQKKCVCKPGLDQGCGCGVALWSGAVGASCTKHECCAPTNYCNNGKCAVLCPDPKTRWDESQKKCVCKPEYPDLGCGCGVDCCPTKYGSFNAGHAHRATPSAFTAGTIGPFSCNYTVYLSYFSVDDVFCVQGSDGHACVEKSRKYKKPTPGCSSSGSDIRNRWHTYSGNHETQCTADGTGILIHNDGSSIAVYNLPAGKTLTFVGINKREVADRVSPNSQFAGSYVLIPGTFTSGGCTGDWVKSAGPTCDKND